jgi:hypothetical protein
MTRSSRLSTVLALFALAGAVSATPDAQPLRIRTNAELESALRRAVEAMPAGGQRVQVEVGDPAAIIGVDIVVGYARDLTRPLDSGRADEDGAVRLGVRARDSMPVLAAPVADSPQPVAARRWLQALAGGGVRHAFTTAAGLEEADVARTTAAAVGAARFAASIVRWWMPACSLERNSYTDPNEALGPPNASAIIVNAHRQYRGLISLGQGGYVVVDMGATVVDRGGPEIRVHQYVADEPVTVYGGDAPNGPFKLVGFRRRCPGTCDFDLADGGVASARYIKVEDGEYYPCLDADTDTEGADLDAIELLNQ